MFAAFVIRFTMALAYPNIHRPDEVFQNLEPAYRLVHGWGVVSWEWRDGIRSWLFPGFLAGLMALSKHLGLGDLSVIAAVLSLISLGVVATGFTVGWRHFGLSGAILCGVLCSFWPDLVYFAPKTLAEIQAGNLLVVAAGIASLLPDKPRDGASMCRVAAIGLLLGMVFCLRFQLSPALLVVGVWAVWRDWRRAWVLCLAASMPVAALGLCDWLTWGSPFQSIWKNIELNFVENRSATYGIDPPYWYFTRFVKFWGVALLPLSVCFALGVARAKLMALVAVTIVAFHSLIAHKEISFIYAAFPPALIVVGIGTSRLVAAMPYRVKWRMQLRQATIAGALFWTLLAAFTASDRFRPMWVQGTNLRPVMMAARGRADLCGLGLYGPDFPWYLSGGYTHLRRAIPLFLLRTPEAMAQARPAMNYVVTQSPAPDIPPDYTNILCANGYCLMRRDKPCIAPDVPDQINNVLAREGF